MKHIFYIFIKIIIIKATVNLLKEGIIFLY